MGIKPTLKVGHQALFHDGLVRVLELIGKDVAVISLGEGAGATQVPRTELTALADSQELFKNSPLVQIPDEIWNTAQLRKEAVQKIAELPSGRAEAVDKAAGDLRLSTRQLWRLVKRYQEHQTVTAMIPEPRGRKPGARVLKLEVEHVIAHYIHEFYLTPERPKLSDLVQRIGAECRKRTLPEPAEKTVARRLKAHETHQSQKKRLGAKQSKYVYVATPGHVEVERALQRIEIDHTPIDVLARSDDPLCDYIGRPWLTIAVDVYTRCVVGIYIGFEPPSALSVALCMAHGVLPKTPNDEFGVPLPWPMHGLFEEITVDNGKDFRSKAFLRGCEEHNIIVCYRPVGSPHYGGTIERLIGTMVGRCHLLPGTTKRSVQARGDYDAVAKVALTLSEVRRWFVEQILGSYHQVEHRTLRMPPIQAWETAVADQQVRELSSNHLDFLVSFLPAETRVLTTTGIEANRLQYWADDLAPWVGQHVKVLVHFDPRDIATVYVRLPSGPVVKAHVTTPGIKAISMAEWKARRASEAAAVRVAARTEITDASLARSDQIIAVAKASRAVRRRRATKAAGDRWMPAAPPVAAPIEALIETLPPPVLSGVITLFDIEDNSHGYH